MTGIVMNSQLFAPLFSSAAVRAIVNDRARLQRMLDFEAALARAEAALGVISATAAGEIADACQADRYDIAVIADAAAEAGNVAIPLVHSLTAEVAKRNKTASGFVHWGATSQDVIDTALVLELRAVIDALLVDLDRATKGFTVLAGRHRRNLGVARTLMQHALPMPFGLKLAGYAAALSRSRERLRRLRKEALALQFGGAAGTLAALGEHGLVRRYRHLPALRKAIPKSDRLVGLPAWPFVGEIGYGQIREVLRRRERFQNRAERALVEDLQRYLVFKKGKVPAIEGRP